MSGGYSRYFGCSKEKSDLLIKEIKNLSEKKEEISENLDQCLLFYLENVAPKERELLSAIVERTKSFYNLYISSYERFSKEEIALLRRLILDEIRSLVPSFSLVGLPSELNEIYTRLSELNTPNSVDDEQKKFRKAEEEKASGDGSSHEELKTKKEEQRESEQGEEKKAQKKSLNRLYKRLVKAFHPDLELDIQEKIWKEEVMKRVIHAYEEKDLYGLMEIEEELSGYLPEEEEREDDEELMTYHAILENKIETLKSHINHLMLSPKYGSLQRFYHNQFIGTCTLMLEYERLREVVAGVRGFVQCLQGPNSEEVFKALIKGVSSAGN